MVCDPPYPVTTNIEESKEDHTCLLLLNLHTSANSNTTVMAPSCPVCNGFIILFVDLWGLLILSSRGTKAEQRLQMTSKKCVLPILFFSLVTSIKLGLCFSKLHKSDYFKNYIHSNYWNHLAENSVKLSYWVCLKTLKKLLFACMNAIISIRLNYRVAAIFPERFQSFTDALKNRFFYYFAQNNLSYLP